MEPFKDISSTTYGYNNFVGVAADLPFIVKCESNSLPEIVSVEMDSLPIENCDTGNKSSRLHSIIETLKMEVTCEEDEIDGKGKRVEKVKDSLNYSSDDENIPLSQYLTKKHLNIGHLINEENVTVKEEIINNSDYKLSIGVLEKFGAAKMKRNDSVLLSKSQRRERRRLRREKRLAKALRSVKLIENVKEKLPHKKKKVYEYKKGKKVFCKSGSESSDFEMYVYFDESKTKRKIKLSQDVSIENLEKEIIDIKMENICLMKEHARINQIKLRERLQLRLEIKRLKAVFMELKLEEYLKNQLTPEVGSTAGLIDILKKHLDNVDYSQMSIERGHDLYQKLEIISFTDLNFWQDFNNIETNTDGISPTPFWDGNLDVIQPNVIKYYKPNVDLMNSKDDKKGVFNVENYSFTNFTWNKKPSKNYDAKYTKWQSPDLNITDDLVLPEFHDEDTHYSGSEIYNADWNTIATKNRNKANRKKEKENIPNFEIDQESYDTKQNEMIVAAGNVTKLEENSVDDAAYDWHNEQTFTDSSNPPDDDGADGGAIWDNSELIQRQNVIAETVEASKAAEEAGICTECGFDSSWSSFISRHREAYQKSIKISPCHSCNMRFLKSGHFDGRHRLKRPPPKKFRSRLFMCDTCGQGCTSRSGLAQHVLQHKEAKYPCPHCPYRCRRKAYIKIHIATHNKTQQNQKKHQIKAVNHDPGTNIQPFNKTFIKNEQNLVVDEEVSKSNVYNCDECTHTSLNKKLLSKHKLSVHGFKAYTCEQCNYSTKKSSTLTQHLRKHAKEKPYQCCHCDYRSSSKSYLKSHERYHTGVTFQCETCQYSCVTASRMKVHLRKHTGETPHRCVDCDYTCSTSHGLKVHMKSHLVGSEMDLYGDVLQNPDGIS